MLRRVSMLHQQGIGTSAWVQHIQHVSNTDPTSKFRAVEKACAHDCDSLAPQDAWKRREHVTAGKAAGNRRHCGIVALWHCHGKSCDRRERSEAEKNSMNVFKIGQIRSQPAFHESIFRSSRCSMFKCLNGARIEGPKSPTVQSCL